MIPVFKSHYSFGRSILTLEDEDEIKNDAPVSIFAICKEHDLKEAYIVDNTMGGFPAAYHNSVKNNIQLNFGYEVVCCANIDDRSEESELTESKVIIWLKNGNNGTYGDLCRFYTKSNVNGYLKKARCDYQMLRDLDPNDFDISIPFYDSFLHRNLLGQGRCVPIFNREVFFHVEDHSLPFDSILKGAILKYAENKHKLLDSHTILYYKTSDIEAYQTFRCIDNRSKFTKPDLEHFGSDQFSFESYLDRVSARKT